MKHIAQINKPMITIVMAVCVKDDPAHFVESIHSVLSSLTDNIELVIVGDGRLHFELNNVIRNVKETNSNFRYYELEKPTGPAAAWNLGIESASGDFIYRMDADDIIRPKTLQVLRDYLMNNPTIDFVGGKIEEFQQSPGDLGRVRSVPLSHAQIVKKMNWGNPFNHVTVMFRKSAIGPLRYEQHDGFVDYLYWLKLRRAKLKFANLNDILVDVRVGNGFLTRRRGLNYASREILFAIRCVKDGLLPFSALFWYIFIRTPVRLLPSSLLNFVYRIVRG